MEMVDALAGGVVYTRSPVDARDHQVYINAAWGLPKSVVDGSVACDLFVVGRSPEIAVARREVAAKEIEFRCFPQEGVCRLELTAERGSRPCLGDPQVLELARLALRLEAHYGGAQDVEWAVDGQGRIHILQCRPLQQQAPRPLAAAPETPLADADLVARGGVAASPGAACGPVYLADRAVDVLQFPAGAVLVTRQALPRWAALLGRAAAVVTEQGGFAGHLANVSREFGVPALFGLQGITARLADGEMVTVDADGRTIRRGRHLPEGAAAAPRPCLMAGSPVFELLRQAGRLITPLHLLDPESPDFRPEKCASLHDITRFIHEKAVLEMFNFGREHNFSERSSKQLHYRVPMQWWILNLDDGFHQEVAGRYVRLEDIASIPMLAFWRGLVAIPWDGPPALDGKGLMAVLFQSTANPALASGVKSAFAERNYFMISRHYCSLSSRLGYHFSTFEALIGDRTGENYIRFTFKGGAADMERRLKRTHFIGDLLREAGFRVEIREDALAARIEAFPQMEMQKRMEVLGYLTLHVRQLDMVMANPAAVRHYREKLGGDMARLMAADGGTPQPAAECVAPVA
jgi:pyruvate,water dikinase